MYKKIYIQDDAVKLDYLSEPIHFNKMPKPYKEVSYKEYSAGCHMWHCEYSGFFQVGSKDAKDMFGEDCFYVSVYCEFNKEEGWAEAINNATDEHKFYRIGCNHNWELTLSDSLTNTYRCKKCGTIVSKSNGR